MAHFIYCIIINFILFSGRFYDGWYQPPGLKRMQKKHIAQQQIKSNLAVPNLSSFWVGKAEARIKCGPIPKNIPHCGGKRYKPCLFNLKDDPCEYRDLSETFPIIYEIMLRRLGEYRKKMAKPRMVTFRDPKANPKKWKGVWTPWKIHPSQKKREKEQNQGSLLNLFGRFPYSLTCQFERK